MSKRVVGPSGLQTNLRRLLVVGYFAITVLGVLSALQPRIFWTMALPLLPIALVLIGFANWRRICPLAFFGDVGRKLNRGAQRRVPKWFERWFFFLTFSLLLAFLVLRLVATNGDGRWLAGLLAGLALAALVTNFVFTGKTWCNFFCPVGFVERVYTDPRALRPAANSQCTRCTACKSSCPDIDQENAFWRDLMAPARRTATYAFPGLVLAFYTYYWLRHGDWEAYFDGRWTQHSADVELAFGAGFFFAPRIPALAAATLTLTAFSAASYLIFTQLERVARRFVEDDERRRHLILALAAFAAFSIFYFFAGAPTLRRIPGAVRVLAFSAPLLATVVLVRRWSRTREQFIRDKSAAKLLRNWPYDQPPPDDPGEVYAWIKAGEHAREQNLAAYANTVREMIADGLVRRNELRLLEGVRKQLGISDREHEQILAVLSEEERELFERDPAGIEERAQLDGYRVAVADALLHHAGEAEIEELRRVFGVDRDTHGRLLNEIRSESGILLERVRAHLERLRELRGDLEQLAARESGTPAAFLQHLLLREQDATVGRIVDLLEAVGDADRIQALRAGLFAADAETRGAAVDKLGEHCPGARDALAELKPWIVGREPSKRAGGEEEMRQAIERYAGATDPFLRAAAVWVAGAIAQPWARAVVEAGGGDANSLVRDTAKRAAAGPGAEPSPGFAGLSTLEKMQLLRSVPLFADLDPEDLHDLVLPATEETLVSPDSLCEEGDEGDDLFVLLEGRASVLAVHRDEAGNNVGESEVAVLPAGEVIGEMSLLDGSPRSATVRPKDESIRVLRIPGRYFRNRLLPRSRVARPLLVTLSQRIRDLTRKVP